MEKYTTVYHITPTSNVKNILKKGLKSSGSEGTKPTYKEYYNYRDINWPKNFIWVEKFKKKVLDWIDEDMCDCTDWTLLKVKIPSSLITKGDTGEGFFIEGLSVLPGSIKVVKRLKVFDW